MSCFCVLCNLLAYLVLSNFVLVDSCMDYNVAQDLYSHVLILSRCRICFHVVRAG